MVSLSVCTNDGLSITLMMGTWTVMEGSGYICRSIRELQRMAIMLLVGDGGLRYEQIPRVGRMWLHWIAPLR